MCLHVLPQSTVPAPVDIEQTISDILDGGEVSFFEYLLPVEGMTIALEVEEGGSTALYASSQLMNPSSAFYDYMIETDSFADVYIDPSAFGTSGVVKRETTTIYVSIEGLGERNSFSLETTVGDTTRCKSNFLDLANRCMNTYTASE